jgi:hypothetical protein
MLEGFEQEGAGLMKLLGVIQKQFLCLGGLGF